MVVTLGDHSAFDIGSRKKGKKKEKSIIHLSKIITGTSCNGLLNIASLLIIQMNLSIETQMLL